MSNKKIIEIGLIENKNKKKNPIHSLVYEYKEKILRDLDEVIMIKYIDNKEKNKIHLDKQDIRNKFVQFYNAYIELNTILHQKNEIDKIITNLLDELINNVVYRSENGLGKDYQTEIDMIKTISKDKSEANNPTKDKNVNLIVTLED